jgi:mannose/fructose/N-acetylgalactosamine-specific phosphotransferase system component IIC
MITARLVPEAQEVLTPGEAVAGMMLNGVGFAKRP